MLVTAEVTSITPYPLLQVVVSQRQRIAVCWCAVTSMAWANEKDRGGVGKSRGRQQDDLVEPLASTIARIGATCQFSYRGMFTSSRRPSGTFRRVSDTRWLSSVGSGVDK